MSGQVEPELGEQAADAHREEDAEPEADGGAEKSEDQGLEQHRAGDLLLAGAQGAEQRQLATALRNQDRERVDDQEGADDQGDAREDQQEGGQEAHRLLDRGGGFVGRLVAGDGLDAVGERAGHGRGQVFLAGAGLGRHPDVGEGVLAVEEELLGGAGVEGGEGRAVERAAFGEPDDADQLGGQGTTVGGRDDVDVLADDIAALAGSVGVEHDLA
jgi:hypothetical protein